MDAVTADDVGRGIIACLKEMAEEAARDDNLFGLRGFPEYHHGGPTHHWESIITKVLEERLSLRFPGRVIADKRFPSYATNAMSALHSGKRGANWTCCDIRVKLAATKTLWIECKAIFECVLLKDATGPCGRDYLGKHPSTSKAVTNVSVQEAEVDADKLCCLRANEGSSVGLLLLLFDRVGRAIEDRPDYRDLHRTLISRKWTSIKETSNDRVAVRAASGFQEHVVFWHKDLGAS